LTLKVILKSYKKNMFYIYLNEILSTKQGDAGSDGAPGTPGLNGLPGFPGAPGLIGRKGVNGAMVSKVF
jgi:hypothetical protein